MKRLPTIDILMKEAARECTAAQFSEIQPEHLLLAILEFSELDGDFANGQIENDYLLALVREELAVVKTILQRACVDPSQLRKDIRKKTGRGKTPFPGGIIHRSAETKALFKAAAALARAEDAPFLNAAHILAAIMNEPTSLLTELLPEPLSGSFSESKDGRSLSSSQPADDKQTEMRTKDLTDLAQMAKELSSELHKRVFGQEAAIGSFVEGLFNAEVLTGEDSRRTGPKALFIFTGPPGVGKSFLAESAAEILGKPLKHFDMTSLSREEDLDTLIGTPTHHDSGSSGALTGFVHEHPDAFLLFSEIEQAHPAVVQLLLKVIDHAQFEDRFLKRDIDFGNTVIILHTNIGKSECDAVHNTAFMSADRDVGRKALFDVVEAESDSRTGEPLFPLSLLSRMDKGFPLLFRQLGLQELIRIAEAQMSRVAALVQTQYLKKLECDSDVTLCLVLRTGQAGGARAVQFRTAEFLKSEVFNLSRLCSPKRLEEIFKITDRIVFEIDSAQLLSDEVNNLLSPGRKPHVLLITVNPTIGEFWSSKIPETRWVIAADPHAAQEIVRDASIDLVMLDLTIKRLEDVGSQKSMSTTISQFDHIPYASRVLEQYKNMLTTIQEVRPDVPCFLVAFGNAATGQSSMDDELAMDFMRWGAIKGIIETDFTSSREDNGEDSRLELARKIQETARIIHIEKLVRDPSFPYETLLFDTAPMVSRSDKAIRIRLRNFKLMPRVGSPDIPLSTKEPEAPRVTAQPPPPIDWVVENDGEIQQPQPIVSRVDSLISPSPPPNSGGGIWDEDQTVDPVPVQTAPPPDKHPPVDSHENRDQEGTTISTASHTPERADKKEEIEKEPEPFKFSWD